MKISNFKFQIAEQDKRARVTCTCTKSALLIAATSLALLTSPAFADPNADRQYTFGVQLMQRDEPALAEEALLDFVKKYSADPRTGDAQYRLALLARKRGDLAVASQHLDRADKTTQFSPTAVLVLRGQIRLEAGDIPGSLAALEAVKPADLPDTESRASAAYLLGAAYRRAANPTAAAKQFDKASEADSTVRGQALLELGKTRIELKQLPGALDALTEASNAKTSPDIIAEARALAADLAYQQKQYERAAEFYKLILTHHQATQWFAPANIGLLRALYAIAQDDQLIKQFEAAKGTLTAEQMPEAMYLLAASQARLKQYAPSQATLTEFYKKYGSQHALAPQVAYLYAVCFYHTDVEGFEKWMQSVEADLPRMVNRLELINLRAQAAIQRNKPDEALRHLGVLVEATGSPFARAALFQRAALHEQLGHAQEAAADYSTYTQRYGEDPSATDAGRRAINLAFTAGQMERGVELSTQWLKRPGLDPAAAAPIRLKAAMALVELNKPDDAQAMLDQLIASKPDANITVLAQFYRGLLLARQAKPATPAAADPATAAAIDTLAESLKGPLPQTQRVEALAVIAQLHGLAGRTDQALDFYEQARQHREPKDFEPQTAAWVGRTFNQRGKDEIALVWLNGVIGRTQVADALRSESMFFAAQSQQRLGHYKEAVDLYGPLIALNHGYVQQGRLGLAQSLAAMDQIEDALGAYDQLLNVEASDIAATALLESGLLRIEVAKRLIAAGDKAAGDKQLTEARRRLNRVSILYNLPQLGAVPIRAELGLAQIDSRTDGLKARARLDDVLQRSTVGQAWKDALSAEKNIAGGQTGDGVFLLRKIIKDNSDAAATAFARQRLKQLGEQP